VGPEWHGTCDGGRIVDRVGNVTLGIVGFGAGVILFLALSTALGSGARTAPAQRCDPSAWPAPSEAPPPLAPADGTRPVAL
jgi:hypothetical protein